MIRAALLTILLCGCSLFQPRPAFYVKHCWDKYTCTEMQSDREYAEGFCFSYKDPSTGAEVEFCPSGAATKATDAAYLETMRALTEKIPDLPLTQ